MRQVNFRRFSFQLILLLTAGFFMASAGTEAEACQANFSVQINGNHVNFNNLSTGTGLSYTWHFGDGISSTIANATHNYSTSGTYYVMLEITDGTCQDSIMKPVVIQPAPNDIIGTVYYLDQGQTEVDHGIVFLIQFDSIQNTLTAIDTAVIDSNSWFFFYNVAQGEYLVKAALTSQSSNYSDYVPTYSDTSLMWNHSHSIEVSSNNWNDRAYIYLLKGTNPGGPGFIGGNVTQGANKKAGPGDPLEGVSVLLLDMNNKPVASAWTDADGKFEFNDIPLMSYKVWPEIPGKTTDPMVVELDAENEEETGLEIFVNETNVTGIFEKPVAYKPQLLDIYPNPAKGIINIDHKSVEGGNLQIRLLNSQGQVVLQRELNAQPETLQHLTLDATALPRGFYFVEVLKSARGSSASFVQKLVIE